jgi:hypothetical protein
MKTLATILLGITLLTVAFPAQAADRGYSSSLGSYRSSSYRSSYSSLGSSSSSGYVYRNPYAAYPSVSVYGYTRADRTYVAPHYRTPANDTIKDNLSYRGYGTIRLPR